jgi:preprotein translocase subunit Sec63
MGANPLEELRRTNEEQYFLKKETELLDEIRLHAACRSERRDLAEATGFADEEILRELQDLGYSRETVRLFHVLPLLQVAWADGFVTRQERELIVGVARTRKFYEGSASDAQLQDWFRNKPSEQFFTRTNRIINTLLTALAPEERSANSDRLVALCTDVASASGGFLGLGKVSDAERLAIEKVAAELEQRHPVGVAKVVAGKRQA